MGEVSVFWDLPADFPALLPEPVRVTWEGWVLDVLPVTALELLEAVGPLALPTVLLLPLSTLLLFPLLLPNFLPLLPLLPSFLLLELLLPLYLDLEEGLALECRRAGPESCFKICR